MGRASPWDTGWGRGRELIRPRLAERSPREYRSHRQSCRHAEVTLRRNPSFATAGCPRDPACHLTPYCAMASRSATGEALPADRHARRQSVRSGTPRLQDEHPGLHPVDIVHTVSVRRRRHWTGSAASTRWARPSRTTCTMPAESGSVDEPCSKDHRPPRQGHARHRDRACASGSDCVHGAVGQWYRRRPTDRSGLARCGRSARPVRAVCARGRQGPNGFGRRPWRSFVHELRDRGLPSARMTRPRSATRRRRRCARAGTHHNAAVFLRNVG